MGPSSRSPEIDQLKQLEGRLHESLRLAEGIAAAVREPLLALDAGLRVLTLNPAFAALFQVEAAAVRGQPLAALHDGAWQQPALQQPLRTLLEANTPDAPAELNDLLLAADFGAAGFHRLRLYARRLPPATPDGPPPACCWAW